MRLSWDCKCSLAFYSSFVVLTDVYIVYFVASLSFPGIWLVSIWTVSGVETYCTVIIKRNVSYASNIKPRNVLTVHVSSPGGAGIVTRGIIERLPRYSAIYLAFIPIGDSLLRWERSCNWAAERFMLHVSPYSVLWELTVRYYLWGLESWWVGHWDVTTHKRPIVRMTAFWGYRIWIDSYRNGGLST